MCATTLRGRAYYRTHPARHALKDLFRSLPTDRLISPHELVATLRWYLQDSLDVSPWLPAVPTVVTDDGGEAATNRDLFLHRGQSGHIVSTDGNV